MATTLFFVPKNGGMLRGIVSSNPDYTNMAMFRKKAQSLIGGDYVYYGMDTDDGIDFRYYPFVLPLPGLPAYWIDTTHGRNLIEPYVSWATETIGGKIRSFLNHQDNAFYRFETVIHLLMFKMRWQDDLICTERGFF